MRFLAVLIFAATLSAADKAVMIHWDASKLQLSWVSLKDGKTKIKVDFLARTMQSGKKQYPISQAETKSMATALIHFLTEYAIASEEWFDGGGVYPEKPQKTMRDLETVTADNPALWRYGSKSNGR